YTVTYMVDGEVYKTENIAYGSKVTAMAVPVKEGHTFGGWSGVPATMPAKDVTVSGSFTVNSYTITYMVDGEVFQTVIVTYGAAITLIDTPTKEGYMFSGWTDAPGTMPAHDVTINGRFVTDAYTVTYMVDGEVYKTENIAYGSKVEAIAVPVKEGHTFSGWSEIPELMPAYDVTISGTFTVNKYLVTFKIGDEVIAADSLEYGATIVAPEAPEKEGYTFDGWKGIPVTVPAKDLIIEGKYAAKEYLLTFIIDGALYEMRKVRCDEEIAPLDVTEKEGHTLIWENWKDTMPAKDYTIRGKYTPNNYAVIYKVDGVMVRTDSIAYGTPFVLCEEPVKEGYTFSGWSKVPETMPAEDVTVSGTFTVNKYLVTFKIGDEVIAVDSLEYGAIIVAPEAPEKEGHAFSGWGEVAETVPAGDVTYEGSYIVNIYKVYYNVDEELVHTAEVAYGEAIPEYAYEPTKEDEIFEGWVGETYETMPAHDVTYVANITNDVLQLTVDNSRLTIYDLTGRKVTSTENLKGGIYIVNGRKVVIK
ncbi:MAG: InlB B-repeat-containing protein, partial [Bacteroidaceae bacterium]|nr:InlB B-repeat-containing protein [Bacteroidaceae bacterium]